MGICSECAQLLVANATHCEHCGAATGGPRVGEGVVTAAVEVEAQMIEGERLRRELATRKRREQEARRLARQEAVRLEVEARQQAGAGKDNTRDQFRTGLAESRIVPEEPAVVIEGNDLRSESEALPAEKAKVRRKPSTRQSSKKKSQQSEADTPPVEEKKRQRADVKTAREREAEQMRLETEARERAEAARQREAERIRLEAEARERAEAEAVREREAERIRLETAARERAEAEAARQREAERIRLETEARERAEAEAARQRKAERLRAEAAEREKAEEERRRAQIARVHPEEKISTQTVTNVVAKTVHQVPRPGSTNGRGTSFGYSIFNDRASVPPARSFSPRIIVVMVVVVGFSVVGLVVGVSKLRTDKQETITSTQPVSEPTTPLAPSGMVYIPGGEFEMGSDQGDEYEKPAHLQRIAPFFIDVDEVTCEAYSLFVKAQNYKSPPGWKGANYPPGSARKPVTGVTWYDASAYARWAGKRLPTEAEWEYAARGTKGYRYPWGNDWKPGQANAEKAATGLSDVGAFQGVSQFGLRDMSGNAWEWTATTIQAYPGGKIDESQLPKEPREEVKVLRGGCYLSDAGQATSTYRFAWPAKGKYSFEQAGFRCARDAK